jgi:hypothetical protein
LELRTDLPLWKDHRDTTPKNNDSIRLSLELSLPANAPIENKAVQMHKSGSSRPFFPTLSINPYQFKVLALKKIKNRQKKTHKGREFPFKKSWPGYCM